MRFVLTNDLLVTLYVNSTSHIADDLNTYGCFLPLKYDSEDKISDVRFDRNSTLKEFVWNIFCNPIEIFDLSAKQTNSRSPVITFY